MSKTIHGSIEDVWNILTDTRCWPQWGPSVLDVKTNDRFIQFGTTGHVKTALLIWLPFTITTYLEKKSWSWDIGTFHATGHTLTATSDKTCRLGFDMPWWAFVYIPICWLALQRIDKLIKGR